MNNSRGCLCVIENGQPYGYTRNDDGTVTWRINPACPYHQAAAAEPWNHSIPWNCPSFWDGCNCEGGPFYTPPETDDDDVKESDDDV